MQHHQPCRRPLLWPSPGRGHPAHLDAVLLEVQVASVDGDAGGDLGQVPPRADDPAGLVAAGAGGRAGGGRHRAPSCGCCDRHAAPTGAQGRGEEPQEQQRPAGPGHPTRRQRGARGAVGTRHPQCSCSAWTLGGCERGQGEAQLGWGPHRFWGPPALPGAWDHVGEQTDTAERRAGRAQPAPTSSSPGGEDFMPILQMEQLRLGERTLSPKVTQPVNAESQPD